jgi:hypothetical protein
MTSLNENVAKMGPFQDVLSFFIDTLVIVDVSVPPSTVMILITQEHLAVLFIL